MARIINHQRTQIGVLKAVGFKDRTIMLHYISYGFWLVLAGSILGLILGPLSLPKLFLESMQAVYTLPGWGVGYSISFVIVAALMVQRYGKNSALMHAGIIGMQKEIEQGH